MRPDNTLQYKHWHLFAYFGIFCAVYFVLVQFSFFGCSLFGLVRCYKKLNDTFYRGLSFKTLFVNCLVYHNPYSKIINLSAIARTMAIVCHACLHTTYGKCLGKNRREEYNESHSNKCNVNMEVVLNQRFHPFYLNFLLG